MPRACCCSEWGLASSAITSGLIVVVTVPCSPWPISDFLAGCCSAWVEWWASVCCGCGTDVCEKDRRAAVPVVCGGTRPGPFVPNVVSRSEILRLAASGCLWLIPMKKRTGRSCRSFLDGPPAYSELPSETESEAVNEAPIIKLIISIVGIFKQKLVFDRSKNKGSRVDKGL